MAQFEKSYSGRWQCGHGRMERGMGRRGMHMRSGHGHGHGHGRGHGGRRGGRRALKHGDLRYLLLQLIDEAPRHGYDLIRAIEEKTSGAYVPSPGVIYPALEVMQDMGWVTVQTGDGKKTFHVTAEGSEALAEAGAAVDAIEARLASLAEGDEDARGPGEVRMALRRLHHGVRQRMQHPDASEVTRQKITAVLSDALGQIEAL